MLRKGRDSISFHNFALLPLFISGGGGGGGGGGGVCRISVESI